MSIYRISVNDILITYNRSVNQIQTLLTTNSRSRLHISMKNNNSKILEEGLLELNLSMTDQQAAQFQYFAEELISWNSKFNLTAINTMKDIYTCLLYTSPSPRDRQKSRMPSSA